MPFAIYFEQNETRKISILIWFALSKIMDCKCILELSVPMRSDMQGNNKLNARVDVYQIAQLYICVREIKQIDFPSYYHFTYIFTYAYKSLTHNWTNKDSDMHSYLRILRLISRLY